MDSFLTENRPSCAQAPQQFSTKPCYGMPKEMTTGCSTQQPHSYDMHSAEFQANGMGHSPWLGQPGVSTNSRPFTGMAPPITSSHNTFTSGRPLQPAQSVSLHGGQDFSIAPPSKLPQYPAMALHNGISQSKCMGLPTRQTQQQVMDMGRPNNTGYNVQQSYPWKPQKSPGSSTGIPSPVQSWHSQMSPGSSSGVASPQSWQQQRSPASSVGIPSPAWQHNNSPGKVDIPSPASTDQGYGSENDRQTPDSFRNEMQPIAKPVDPIPKPVFSKTTSLMPITTVGPGTYVLTTTTVPAAICLPHAVMLSSATPKFANQTKKTKLRPLLPRPVAQPTDKKTGSPTSGNKGEVCSRSSIDTEMPTLQSLNTPKSPLSLTEENKARAVISKLTTDELMAIKEGDCILHCLVYADNKYLLNAVLERLKREGVLGELLNSGDSEDKTPLILSVEYSSPDLVELFLEYGADTNMQGYEDRLGKNALHIAATKGSSRKNLKILYYLLKHNSTELETKNSHGHTALHLAVLTHHQLSPDGTCKIDSKWNVEMLMRYGALPYTQDGKFGKTALHYAVESQDVELVKSLLRWSAENYPQLVNISTMTNVTPLHLAASINFESEEDHINMVKTLLDHDADREIKTRDGRYPKNMVYLQRKEVLKLLAIPNRSRISESCGVSYEYQS